MKEKKRERKNIRKEKGGRYQEGENGKKEKNGGEMENSKMAEENQER